MSTHDVWVEVDLEALKHNLKQVRSILAEGVRIMAVVKSNGFGHGYVEPSRAFLEGGADALAVTRLDEALLIRAAGITAPILLFAPVQSDNIDVALEADLDLTATNVRMLRIISEAAKKQGRKARVHIKVDTGMCRLGVAPEEVPSVVQTAGSLSNLKLVGIYTHFATAAEADVLPAFKQLELFVRIVAALKDMGFDTGLTHAANSAAIIRMPNSHFDMVRPGTLLYGQYPSQHVPHNLDLRSTWMLKARICEVKNIPAGSSIGYGAEYIAKRPMKIAVVPVGYADGFTLVPEGPIYRQSFLKFAAKKLHKSLALKVRGQSAPVLGRVAMQMTTIDVTGIGGVAVGDEVVVPALRIPTNPLIPRVYLSSRD